MHLDARERLDTGQRRPREPALHQLAIDEERIGRAIDEKLAVPRRLEHHPLLVDAPRQQLARGAPIDDLHARQANLAPRFDDERPLILHRNDAQHLRIGTTRKKTHHHYRKNSHPFSSWCRVGKALAQTPHGALRWEGGRIAETDFRMQGGSMPRRAPACARSRPRSAARR
ncbi:MAG TPA: hypothetical protein VF698_07125 [Thermoanaerobaculia bacterium]